MKQKKTKILSFLLAVIMLLSVPATSLASDISENTGQENPTQEDNINYLDKLKETAQKDVETKAAEKIEEINSEEAEETEKTVAIKTVNDVKNKALVEIKAAKTEEEVETAKSTGITAIEEISVKKAEDNLKGARAVADDGINTFQELKDAIADSTVNEIVVSGNIEIAETLNIDHPITIKGINEDITLTVNSDIRHFTTDEDVIFEGITLDGENKGGGIQVNSGNLTLNKVSINNCTADKGGAVYANEGTITIDGGDHGVVYENNTAINGGGAIFVDGDDKVTQERVNLTILNATFKNNSTSGYKGWGGAIYSGEARNPGVEALTIKNTIFEGNKTTGASGHGGALFSDADNIVMEDVTFKDNHALGFGEYDGDPINMADGGAVYLRDSALDAKNIAVEDNTSIGSGGAINFGGTSKLISITDSAFSGNVAKDGHAGAIYISKSDNVDINNTQFIENSASSHTSDAGALYLKDFSTVNIGNSEFSKNTTGRYGGAIYINGNKGKSNILGSNFEKNEAAYGGAIQIASVEEVNVDNSSFAGNSAAVNGGAINVLPAEDRITTDEDFIYYSPLKVSNTEFKDNTAKKGFYRLDKEKFPAIYGVYKSNIKDLKSLSIPADLQYDTAYNNYDISFRGDLIIKKTDNVTGDKVKIGDVFKYSVTIENTGKENRKDVKISDEIPKLLNIVSVTPKDAKISGQKIEYTVPEIKTGETFTMTIEVKVNSSAKDGDKIKNIAVVDEKDVPSRELIVDEPSTSTGWTWSGGGSTTTTLNKDDHYAYMIGYPNGTVKPEGKITRAEVSTIFFRMMTDNSRNSNWSSVNNYNDVGAEIWYNNAISTLSNAKAVTGYPDGSFKPNAKITRGEFATMASRFLSDTSSLTNNKFTDVKGNWAEESINKLASLGLISGYTDGSFKPDQEITRAEAATLMNAVLERTPDKDHLLSNMKTWTDNSNRNTWYYAQIQEATNSHTYTRPSKTSIETWRELLPVRDWAALEKAWSNANSASGGGSVIK